MSMRFLRKFSVRTSILAALSLAGVAMPAFAADEPKKGSDADQEFMLGIRKVGVMVGQAFAWYRRGRARRHRRGCAAACQPDCHTFRPAGGVHLQRIVWLRHRAPIRHHDLPCNARQLQDAPAEVSRQMNTRADILPAHKARLRMLLTAASLGLVLQPALAVSVIPPGGERLLDGGSKPGFLQVARERGGGGGGGGGARAGGGGGGARAGGGARTGGGGNRQNFNSNNFHNDVSANKVANRSANRNTSVNRNVNTSSNVNVSGGCCSSYDSGPGWGGVAAGAATGVAVGAIASSAASTAYAPPPPTYPPGYVNPPPY